MSSTTHTGGRPASTYSPQAHRAAAPPEPWILTGWRAAVPALLAFAAGAGGGGGALGWLYQAYHWTGSLAGLALVIILVVRVADEPLEFTDYHDRLCEDTAPFALRTRTGQMLLGNALLGAAALAWLGWHWTLGLHVAGHAAGHALRLWLCERRLRSWAAEGKHLYGKPGEEDVTRPFAPLDLRPWRGAGPQAWAGLSGPPRPGRRVG